MWFIKHRKYLDEDSEVILLLLILALISLAFMITYSFF